MGWVVWLLQPLKVKHFLEMIKNAENGHFLQAVKSHYFGNFYSKLCCSNRNQVNDMKPKPHKTYFPKFSENINGLFVTPVVIEIFQFESRTSVVVNFCRFEGDDSPVSFVLYGPTFKGWVVICTFHNSTSCILYFWYLILPLRLLSFRER